jgi:hypothetical protein
MGGCVMAIFNHGTPSSMPLQLKELSIVMCVDQRSLWITPPSNMSFVLHPSKLLVGLGMKNNGSSPSAIMYQNFASRNPTSSHL